MINLHLTKITKLFDLKNLELYGTYDNNDYVAIHIVAG